VACARWVTGEEKKLQEFKNKVPEYLALDSSDTLTYLAPTRVNITLAQERYPDIQFSATREH
ncbi:MAG: peptide chain release factor 3, partial [Pseudomonadota bacterium]|nr:peptide chain release factor 3 [Pseudomonadota bacterium]